MTLPEKCHFYPFFLPRLRHLVLDPDNNKEKKKLGVILQPSRDTTDSKVDSLTEIASYTVCPTNIEQTSYLWDPYSATWTPQWLPLALVPAL